MDNGWLELNKRPPKRDERRILVWHVFQGVMLARADECRKNRFFTHWRELPAEGWIRAEDRHPARQDADEYSCVLAWDEHDGPHITGWHQFAGKTSLTRWMPVPEGPRNRPRWQETQ